MTMEKKNCLITGGARGIGLSIKSELEKQGYNVFAPTRSEMDLSDENSVRNFINNFKQKVDILINNAGENIINPIEKINFSDWQRMMQLNLSSAFMLIQNFAPLMAQREFGRIVNISSLYSMRARPGRATYSATKAGLNSLTQSAAIEFATKNVLVNSVSPGFVETALTFKNNSPEQIQVLLSKIPMGRMAKSEEIARVVLFLVSDANTYITGQNLIVDGGYSCL